MENRYWRPYRRSEEFQEEDIWNVIIQAGQESAGLDSADALKSPPSHHGSISRRLPSAAKMIPVTHRRKQHESVDEQKLVQHSVPVSIPDWSKIYGKSLKMNDEDGNRDGNYDNVDEEEESDEEGDRVPPHEWLAKKFARSQISSFSVCEGAGRTLKGRDLSRVRDAVLSKTGFL